LRSAGDAALWRAFGKHGRTMRERASGIDDRPVVPDREEKSISAEETYATDIQGSARLTVELLRLADRTASRLRAHDLAAGTVSVKIRRDDFTTYTRQRSLGSPTQDSAVVSAAATSLLEKWLAGQPDAAVRLLGVGVSDLQMLPQGDLFGSGPAQGSRLDSVIDGIRDRFGADMLTRASLLSRSPDDS
jgi:DNA polymerase-4